jgi:hypothetical protein
MYYMTPDGLVPAQAEWVAVSTGPRADWGVQRLLELRALGTWLPTMKVRRRSSDRWKEVESPVFPRMSSRGQPNENSPLSCEFRACSIVKQGPRAAWIEGIRVPELHAVVAQTSGAVEPAEVIDEFSRRERDRVKRGWSALCARFAESGACSLASSRSGVRSV